MAAAASPQMQRPAQASKERTNGLACHALIRNCNQSKKKNANEFDNHEQLKDGSDRRCKEIDEL